MLFSKDFKNLNDTVYKVINKIPMEDKSEEEVSSKNDEEPTLLTSDPKQNKEVAPAT